MKRPQTKFHSDTMSNAHVITSKKVKIHRLVKLILQHSFFLCSIFYWNYNNRYWCVFACL